MRILYSAFLLFTGVLLGWWLHSLQLPGRSEASAVTNVESIRPQKDSTPERELVLSSESEVEPSIDHVSDNTTISRRFRQLLEQQDFDQAVAFYEKMQSEGNDYQALLRPVLVAYSEDCRKRCSQGVFVRLADAWLASYYDDIPIMLQLAEHQREQGFHAEAANVLNLAMTYAYTPKQREQVVRALRQLVKSTDAYLSERQRWIELLGFYEYLNAISLSETAFGLRQAMIYQLLDEPETARKLLLALQAGDDGLNLQLTRALNDQLGEIGLAADSGAGVVATDAVPLSRRGDHYMIQATLNNRQQVLLMIDTGASVTSLSRSSFLRLGSDHFFHLGSRMFNTANGLAQGEVYRADTIALGGNRIDDIDVAILDYEPANGADGLLGMNVLRNYRFEIDQEKELLYLRPR